MVKKRVTIVLMEDREEGVFHARVPDIPAVITSGVTIEEALNNAKEALEGYLEGHDEDPDDIGDTGPVTLGIIEIDVPEPAQAKAPHS